MEEDKVEEDNYRAKEVFSFRELFLIQVRRCMNVGSREMTEGFWIYSSIQGRTPEKMRYIGDARKEFINSVISLVDLTQTRFDTEAKTKTSEILEKIKEEHAEVNSKVDESNYEKGEEITDDWWKRKVEIYRELFREVCNFGERKKWFETKATTE